MKAAIRKQLHAALLRDWIHRWSVLRGRRPGIRQTELLSGVLGRQSTRQTSLRISESHHDTGALRKVFPLGLPGLNVLQEFVEPVAQEIERAIARIGIIGDTPALKRALHTAACFAKTSAPALIMGETGSGKDLLAQFIHEVSPRRTKPFIALSCAAVPESLLLSELFGYDAGAFTGAGPRGKIGKAEAANGGTLFLDEIGELSLQAQAALLRFVDSGEIQKIGRTRSMRLDVRLIGATHRDLAAMVKQKSFREDLYYRIALLPIELAPLRKRRSDIAELVAQFLRDLDREHRKRNATELTAKAMQILTKHGWPGNIRELKFSVTRAYLLARGASIESHHLQFLSEQEAIEHDSAHSLPKLREKLQAIRVPLFRDHAGWYDFLRAQVGGEFQNRDVVDWFEYSESAARIRLAALVSHGVLTAEGHKKGRKYRLTNTVLGA